MERSTRGFAAMVAAGGLAVVLAAPAQAAVSKTVTATKASATACHDRYVGKTASTDEIRLTASATGIVRARLSGGGDWDVAVFDRNTGKAVAAAAGWDSVELAEGYVASGMDLVAQACRFNGSASTAELTVDVAGASTGGGGEGKTQVVDVRTETRADRRRLQALELDLTEHGDSSSLEVVLHGDADAKKLRDAGFTHRVRIADLDARIEANRRADLAYAAQTPRSPLPSGRDAYRHLWEYDAEMKLLAMRYPSLVKPLVLNHETHEGRKVYGVEITEGAGNVADGKPVFLQMGVHHAREWPSSEHAMEFAYDLVNAYNAGGAKADLVRRTRTIVVPIVNRDGFNVSREAREVQSTSQTYWVRDHEMKRKNCSGVEGVCATVNRLAGVDPNRNYGGFWGGPGAGLVKHDDTYRGPAPFSEPETRNIKDLVSSRQVVTLITNHTYSNLILRPPGLASAGRPIDELAYRALGESMAARNKYVNLPSYGLYDTSGTTEDWSYYSTGGLGFTFEIGPDEFHPPYRDGVVAEYLGLAPAEGAGSGGNQAAYWAILAATADPAMHSVLEGAAPAGSKLKLTKSFVTETAPVIGINGQLGAPETFSEALSSELTVGRRGTFTWDVNPSTRPAVAGTFGREDDPALPPQGDIPLTNPPGVPPEDPTSETGEWVEFEVLPGFDNGSFNVHLEWPDPRDDWDIQVFKDGVLVTASESFGDDDEDAFLEDPEPGTYRVKVINWDSVAGSDWISGVSRVTFGDPRPGSGPKPGFEDGEAYDLTCTTPAGTTRSSRVKVARGEVKALGKVCG